MGFKAREILPLPTKEGILEAISPEDIFHRYIGSLPRKAIPSPLRDDKKASFSLFFSKAYDQFFYKDFATGDTGDCFVFVKRLFRYSNMNQGFNRIANDFHLTQFKLNESQSGGKIFAPRKEKIVKEKKTYRIKVTERAWNIDDKHYWFVKYGLGRKELEHCKIHPISWYYINDVPYRAEKLSYVFTENKDGVETYKIYQPNSVHRKWINNNNFSTWELWSQMPMSGENLIITSSRKDAAVVKSMFNPNFITSCALQGETVNPKPSVIKELKLRFKNIFILYDNDYTNPRNPGRLAGLKIATRFNIKQLEISQVLLSKDISDYRENHGETATEHLILNLIKEKQ